MPKIISKDELINDLISTRESLGKIPTYKDYLNIGKYSATTIQDKFGSWSNAMLEVFDKKCKPKDRTYGKIEKKCEECGVRFSRNACHYTRSKSNQFFCSFSCHGKYRQKNKEHGSQISKLEIFIQKELIKLYPDLHFDFNKRDVINSELDIYIPSLKLAFEINGIFHYEPIYGQERLNIVQSNDARKFAACRESGISLCVIGTQWDRFNKTNAQKYLEIVTDIINERL